MYESSVIVVEAFYSFVFTKNQYQLVVLYYLFFGYFSYMFRPDLIGHLQGDFYNMCSVYFDLSSRYSSRPARAFVSLWTVK